MHLQKYREETNQSQSNFGKRLDPVVSQGLISQWELGITRITLEYALQIERETNGAVTPQDCADMFITSNQRQSLTEAHQVPSP